MEANFKFKAKVWLWSANNSAWHFVTLPEDLSDHIKSFDMPRRGFGSVRVKVTIGKTTWDTSVFPDSKKNAYVLPLKASVRKAEKILMGEMIEVAFDML